MLRIVYDRRVNLGFPGGQRLHPFDLRKFARAWKELRKTLGSGLAGLHISIAGPVNDETLGLVHEPEYLQSLRQSAVVAQAVEVPALRRAPWWLLDRFVLQPMRWATAGTIAAGRAVVGKRPGVQPGRRVPSCQARHWRRLLDLQRHCRSDSHAAAEGHIPPERRVLCVDLDAHMGNGVAWCFRDDPTVFLFDMHNDSIYPMWDLRARERIDRPMPVPPGCSGEQYLERLQAELPPFLDSVTRSAPVALAIYNAGTDVLGRRRPRRPGAVARRRAPPRPVRAALSPQPQHSDRRHDERRLQQHQLSGDRQHDHRGSAYLDGRKWPRRSPSAIVCRMAQKRISQQELNELLSPFGFRPMLGGCKSFGLSRSVPRVWRPSEVVGCFEIVDVDGDSGGNYIWLYADILSGHAGHIGMFEDDRLVVPLLEGRIKTAAERQAWLENFVKIVPKKSAASGQTSWPALLKRTAQARAAAKFYLSFLPAKIDDFVAYWNELKDQATPEQRELARISLRPATIGCITTPPRRKPNVCRLSGRVVHDHPARRGGHSRRLLPARDRSGERARLGPLLPDHGQSDVS